MHAPADVDVEDPDELVAPGGVMRAADGVKEGGDVDVGADDGVEDPFEAKVRYPFEAGGEGVDARDGDRGGGREALAGEEAEEGSFAGAVCWGKVLLWLIYGTKGP